MKEEQIKEEIEQIGYREFYRYYQEAGTLIEMQKEEIERLNNIINKAIEYINNNKDLSGWVHCLDEGLLNILQELKGSDKSGKS